MAIEFVPEASTELIEAAAHYEAELEGLGDTFVEETERVTQALEDHPALGHALSGPFRNFPLERFPYSVVYVPEPNRILVVAVAHQRRRPGYWKGRKPR